MNDGEKLVRMYCDDKNMMMLKMKYQDKEMMSMMILVALMMHLIPLSPAHRQQWVRGLQ